MYVNLLFLEINWLIDIRGLSLPKFPRISASDHTVVRNVRTVSEQHEMKTMDAVSCALSDHWSVKFVFKMKKSENGLKKIEKCSNKTENTL